MNTKSTNKSPMPDNWSSYSKVAIGLAISILYAMKYPNLIAFDYLVITIGIIMAAVGGYKLLKKSR